MKIFWAFGKIERKGLSHDDVGELWDIVELTGLHGCSSCFLNEDGSYCANYVKSNRHREKPGELGAYVKSGETISEPRLRGSWKESPPPAPFPI